VPKGCSAPAGDFSPPKLPNCAEKRDYSRQGSVIVRAVLEAAFDEAWLTLKSNGNTTVKPSELARSVLRLGMEGERDPVRLHDRALEGLIPASAWREAS
jgi:hypothetical protein